MNKLENNVQLDVLIKPRSTHYDLQTIILRAIENELTKQLYEPLNTVTRFQLVNRVYSKLLNQIDNLNDEVKRTNVHYFL